MPRLGSMCRQGARTTSLRGKMDSSPFFDFPGKPSTPTMSPRFTLRACTARHQPRTAPRGFTGRARGRCLTSASHMAAE